MKPTLLLILVAMLLTGCTRPSSKDPVENGCGQLAAAIVASAIIRAIFNK